MIFGFLDLIAMVTGVMVLVSGGTLLATAFVAKAFEATCLYLGFNREFVAFITNRRRKPEVRLDAKTETSSTVG